MGKSSRAKGARGERMLRDELRRHGWEDVSREGWKQVKGGQEACDDVVGKPPGGKTAVSFENKFYATGFDKYYKILSDPEGRESFCTEEGECLIVTQDPNQTLASPIFYPISTFDKKTQKAMRSLVKKCRDWIGKAQILSLKQDRMPFLYVRYRR